MSTNDQVGHQVASLYRCRKEIITDLDVQDILPDLLSQLVIDHRDKQLIDHETTLEDKAEKLLIIIEEKASTNSQLEAHIIPLFINSLKTKYDWLYKRLIEDEPDSRVIPLQPGLLIRNKFLENVKDEEAVFEPLYRKDSKANRILEAGGVQCLPAVAVERKTLLNQIQSELKTLKRNRYLVIQGMAGSGKSVLATQAIHDCTLVEKAFPDGVFWLAVGKECGDSKDALLAKMRILCDKLGESRAPNSFEHGADLLRTAFLKKPDSLLILDDVWRPEVIRAFDVGCRTLVTTRDSSVIDVVNGRVKCIRVEDGFTEEESLQLFSQVLKINSIDLPTEAKSIHCECKGSPMVISLISSLLQEHQVSDIGRWQYYLESLTKRKYSKMKRYRAYEHESIVDAISLSIEGLSPDSKRLYADFGLFQDDVGIPCSVLMTLWNMQKYEVEDIMKEFARKSLAVEEFDSQKKCYSYFIHDLLLDYLKYQLVSEDRLEERSHEKLVERYITLCNGEFYKLPDDGYIFFYLGYHLYKAKMYHCFPKVYLNLQFIGEKLRITGPADLLVDIRKYLDFIVAGDENQLKLIEEIQTFAQLVGHRIYGQLDVDVIQIALQTPHLTRIYEQAKELAHIASNRLYLEWKNAKSGQWKHPESTVLCADHINCVKFVGKRGGHFIAGLSNGYIQLCDLESSAVCHVFRGHTDSVQSLQVFPIVTNSSQIQINVSYTNNQNGDTDSKSKHKLVIVSASADKTCKVWDLQTILEKIESKPFELKMGRLLGTSPSPKLRPDQWAFDNQKDESVLSFELHTAPVSFAQFSMDGFKVVSTSTNEIMIWSSSNGQIISKVSLSFDIFPDLTLQRCLFPPEPSPSYLLSSAENQIILLSASSASIYAGIEGHAMRIVELLFISQDSICTVSENEIGIWKVTKRFPKSKAFRSRSLSPSRCPPVGKTEADSVLIRPSARTLDPKDIQVDWQNGCDCPTVESTIPASRSADHSISSSSTVFIEDGNVAVQISKEETLPSKISGFFLCASFASSSDGKLLACGTSDHKIVLWRLDRRQYLGNFTSHTGWVTCLDFSAVDLGTLMSGSEDHTVMVWDIQDEENGTKEPQKSVRFTSTFVPVNFDQGYFLSAFSTEKNTVQIYKDAKRISETVAVEKCITAISLSRCGTFCAAGTSDGSIFQLPTKGLTTDESRKTPLVLRFIETLGSCISCLNFGPSKEYLVAGSAEGVFMVMKSFVLIQKFLISTQPVVQIDFIFQHFVAARAQDSATLVIDLNNMNNTLLWKKETDIHVTCSEISTNANDSILGYGTITDGVLLLNLKKSSDNKIHAQEQVLDAKQTSPVRALAFDSGSVKIAVGYDNGMISIWNIEGNLPKKEMELVLHKSWVRSLKFSPQNIGTCQWLISCGDKLAFWNLDKNELKPRRSSFMAERRRRRSGESPARNTNRLSLEIPDGSKIGRQGKRELLQQFSFRGNYSQYFHTDPSFCKIITVDDTGIFYLLEMLKSESRNPASANI